jgi:hypothetical protein
MELLTITSMTTIEKIETINAILLALTTVMVWFYTRAAQRSNEIQEEPLLSLSFKDTTPLGNSSTRGEIRVKNIGKGSAYNIQIEPFPVAGYFYKFYLENPSLEQLESAGLKAFVKTPNDGVEIYDSMGLFARLIPQTLRPETLEYARNNPAIFVIHYQGVNGKKYSSAFALYSTLPPAGDIIVQFIVRGNKSLSLTSAKKIWLSSEKIKSPAEG